MSVNVMLSLGQRGVESISKLGSTTLEGSLFPLRKRMSESKWGPSFLQNLRFLHPCSAMIIFNVNIHILSNVLDISQIKAWGS